ncbi:DUF6898 family protein [Aquidulcibacter sp.]|jgi:hypothetical protein|uniref:DUF6898 family protein n=1 Tax=Aquidulcibacter sp. TaxID=2052990 RepID=UPI0025BDD288|nr:hypothetical protein [Aquidulcibacter sp.]MCA3696064.1 hypothetical protein [Aquidulcibacter sp.]
MPPEVQPDPLLRQLAAREIYIERQIRGPYAQIRAIDALTGLEVAVTTPSNAAQFDQNRLALRKLGQCLIAQGHMVLDDRDPREADPSNKAADLSKNTSTSLPKGGFYT